MKNNCEKRIKVLFLAGWYPNKDNPISGIFIKRHAEAVSKYCEVAVLYIHSVTSRKEATVEYTIEDGIKTIRVYPGSVQFQNRFLRYLVNRTCQNFIICSYKGMKVIQKEFGRPDITHVNVILPMGILAVILKVFKGIPFVLTEHTGPFNVHLSSPFHRIFSKIILKNTKKILPVSTFLKKQMAVYYPGTKYQVIPNVVDCKIFYPNSIKKAYPKKRMLHVSLMDDAQKNISFLINAIKKISVERSDFELHIVGDGNDRKKLEILSKNLGLYNKIIFFHGMLNQKDLAEFYRHCDFFILVSPQETFAVVCAEALTSGLPVITTRCGGPEDYIDENVGIAIKIGNQEELILAIEYMLDNSEKFDPNMLHEYAKNRFGYDVVGKQYFDIYTSIILTRWNIGQGQFRILINSDWIVGDIGSGHNPHRRADILIDREIGMTPDRSGAIAVIPKNKAFLLADVSRGLPLKNKAFDYTIASHVAEHVDDPETFCSELSRISKRGYIETPGPVSDFFLKEPYHKWLVFKRGRSLVFKEKRTSFAFCELFYRVFYYGEPRYGHKLLRFNSKILNTSFLFLRYILNRLWKFIPFTYTYFEWETEIHYQIIR